MVGCASGPQLGQTAAVPIETTDLPAVPERGSAGPAGKGKPIPIAPYGDPQPTPAAKSSRGMVAAVLVLALAVGAAGAAIFTSQRNDALPATTDAAATDSNLTSAPVTSQAASTGLLPAESDSQMVSEIKTVIDAHHQAVASGDYSSAFSYLSSRKQESPVHDSPSCKDASCWGATMEGRLRSGLNTPVDSQVQIRKKFPKQGDVEIWVSLPDYQCPNNAWEGITWVRYENGEWKYDPGYSTTRPGGPYDTVSSSNHERGYWDSVSQGRSDGGVDSRLLGAACGG